MRTETELLKTLDILLSEAHRLYEANGRGPYEAGVYEGIKRTIIEVQKIK